MLECLAVPGPSDSPYTADMINPRTAVHRIEVRPKQGMPDPRGAAALREAQSLGVSRVPDRIEAASVYLLEGELDDDQVQQVATELLADPVTEAATIGA